MKKIVLTLLLIVSSAFANEINWAKDFESGIAQAQKEHKPVLFVFSRHSCKYCVKLEKETFADSKVIEDLNKNFVSIIAYSDEGDKFPQYLWRPGTPTIWFLNEKGEPMYQEVMGFIPPQAFIGGLNTVKNSYAVRGKKAK